MDTVKFYFSFRSPYAWLAYHRVTHALAGVPVNIRPIPVYPPKNFANDPTALPSKAAYIAEDVARIAAAYGLEARWPAEIDTDWMRPHAAYLYAADQSCGDAFALAAYAARFTEGQDLGTDQVLRAVADRCGLDATATVRAADDPAVQQRVMAGLSEGLADGIFGVPFFVYRGQKFWGNDRLEWLLRAIFADNGRAVPDLTRNLLTPPLG